MCLPISYIFVIKKQTDDQIRRIAIILPLSFSFTIFHSLLDAMTLSQSSSVCRTRLHMHNSSTPCSLCHSPTSYRRRNPLNRPLLLSALKRHLHTRKHYKFNVSRDNKSFPTSEYVLFRHCGFSSRFHLHLNTVATANSRVEYLLTADVCVGLTDIFYIDLRSVFRSTPAVGAQKGTDLHIVVVLR